jgi:hypothetical protein
MKLRELFQGELIQPSFIESKFDGAYWESALKFVRDNWDRSVTELSDKQSNWAKRILDDCVEKRIEG